MYCMCFERRVQKLPPMLTWPTRRRNLSAAHWRTSSKSLQIFFRPKKIGLKCLCNLTAFCRVSMLRRYRSEMMMATQQSNTDHSNSNARCELELGLAQVSSVGLPDWTRQNRPKSRFNSIQILHIFESAKYLSYTARQIIFETWITFTNAQFESFGRL